MTLAPNTPEALASALERAWASTPAPRGAAILIPLIPTDNGFEVLFEQRAFDLAIQPGEVCFPGGHTEPGESPRDTAVRETCEELCIDPSHIELIGELAETTGPSGVKLWPFIGILSGYAGTFSEEEVATTFTIPLQWFFDHEPEIYRSYVIPSLPDDFPYDRYPVMRGYKWIRRPNDVTFYRDTDPLIWGMTARILNGFVQALRAGVESGLQA